MLKNESVEMAPLKKPDDKNEEQDTTKDLEAAEAEKPGYLKVTKMIGEKTDSFAEKFPIYLGHNNDILDDYVFGDKCNILGWKCSKFGTCFCSLLLLIPAVITFWNNFSTIGKISGAHHTLDNYRPWHSIDDKWVKKRVLIDEIAELWQIKGIEIREKEEWTRERLAEKVDSMHGGGHFIDWQDIDYEEAVEFQPLLFTMTTDDSECSQTEA